MSTPLPGSLRPLTLPASRMYRLLIAGRNRWYDNPRRVARIGVPVISMGNITTGGTGKTPFVRLLAERLLAAGHVPAIVMRGYGARPGAISDEHAEYADLLPGVPVIASPNRLAAMAEQLPHYPNVTCVLLDDGFQHRQVHRDLDFVLVDGSHSRLDDQVLPAGHLREPATNLARADAVIITRAAKIDETLARRVEQLHGRPPLAWCAHEWDGLDVFAGEGGHSESTDWLDGRRIAVMLGIGNPHAMREQLRTAGARILHDEYVRDHQRYSDTKLHALRARCHEGDIDALVVTHKDWVKLRDLLRHNPWPIPIAVPRLRIRFIAGEDAFAEFVGRTFKANND